MKRLNKLKSIKNDGSKRYIDERTMYYMSKFICIIIMLVIDFLLTLGIMWITGKIIDDREIATTIVAVWIIAVIVISLWTFNQITDY